MNKILVEVYVPLLERSFDVFIPINKKIKNVARLLNEAIIDLSNGAMIKKEDIKLYNRDTGYLLNPYHNVKEAGLANGSQIILI